MLARQFETDAALHRGHQFERGSCGEDLVDEGHVREIVFYIENAADFFVRGLCGNRAGPGSGKRLERRLRPGKIEPEGRAISECARNADCSVHRLDEALAKSEAKAGAFNGRFFGAQSIKRGKE